MFSFARSRQRASREWSGQRKLDLNPHSSEAPDTDPLYHALAFEVTTAVQSDFRPPTRRTIDCSGLRLTRVALERERERVRVRA